MGIFSDKCINPECNGRVLKAAKFCRLCGSPASDADTNCGRCGAVVATSSKFCWKCGIKMTDQQKPMLFDNRWIRDKGDFAIRVEECDIAGFLTKGLIVEHGTRGMVFQKGRFCGYVDSGMYDVNGFLKKVNIFSQTSPTSIVLMDTSNVELHVETVRLYSKEQMMVDVTLKLIVKLNDPEKMYTNAFKSQNRLTINCLAGVLSEELHSSLQAYISTKSIQQLYSNTVIRREVEEQIQAELKVILEQIGFDVVQLRFIDLFCQDYEQIREEQAKLYINRRRVDISEDRLKLAQRIRESLTDDRMNNVKTEKDFEDFVRQTEHQLGLKEIIRVDEMDSLKRRFGRNRNKDILAHQIEMEGIKNKAVREEAYKNLEARIENFKKKKNAEREDALNKAETRDTIKRIESKRDIEEATAGIELLRQVQNAELTRKEREQKIEAERLKARSEASAQALLSILDGPVAKRIADLEKLRIKQKLTPEQLIVMTAADSSDVAQALAEKYKAEAAISNERFEQFENFIVQQQKTSTDSGNRLERVMNVALQQMGNVATTHAIAHQSESQIVTKPPPPN